MATITDLPIEIIYIILQQKIINIEDFISFSLTCKRFNDALNNDLLWKTKLYQSFDIRWPYLKKIYNNRIQNKESINFKDEVKANVNVERNVRKALFSYLSLLSKKLFNKRKLPDSDIHDFDILFYPNISATAMSYHFFKDELLYQIKMSPLHPKCNLTHQYYSKMLLLFLQRRHLGDVWLKFIDYPEKQQLLENAATIVAQWFQPQKRIYNFDIDTSLDDIAQQTLNSLKKTHCDHPIFSTSAKQFSFWKYNNIDDNQWSKIEEMQIINVLHTVLFDELGFRLNSTCNPKPEDIFIDCVLKSKIGDAITLAIIFQSVARRLGVRCDLVYSVLGWLCWKPKSIAKNPEDEEYFYIDILHGGTIRGRNDCPIESYNKHKKIRPIQMVYLMNSEILTDTCINQDWTLRRIPLLQRFPFQYVEFNSLNIISLMLQRNPCDEINMSDLLLSSRCDCSVLHNNFIIENNKKSVEASYRTEDILKTFKIFVKYTNLEKSRNFIVSKNRTSNIKYAVGMIVTCIKNDPNQTGVIIEWDEEFDFDAKILKYKQLNYKIIFSWTQTRTAKQPFYIILSEDGNVYYAAQDSLIEASPRWIEHSEIGRYFCRFADGYYVPNEGLTSYYPHDQLFFKIFFNFRPLDQFLP